MTKRLATTQTKTGPGRRNEKETISMEWIKADLADEATWCPPGTLRWVAAESTDGEKTVGLFARNGEQKVLFSLYANVNDGRDWAITHWAPAGIEFPKHPEHGNEATT